MDEIVIKVSDLLNLATQLKSDKMQYVKLTLMEGDSCSSDDSVPPCMCASAVKSIKSERAVDYDAIDAAPDVCI